MKKLYALVIGCLCVWNLAAQTNHLTDILVTEQQIHKKGRQIELQLKLDLSGLKVKQQQSILLFPAIVAHEGNRRLDLSPLRVEGKIRQRVHRRQKALTGVSVTDGAYDCLDIREARQQPFTYTATVPYEPWMMQSRLVLCEKVTGCLECQEGAAESTLQTPLIEPFVPHYRLPFLVPEKEEVKRRDEVRVARIQFRRDSYQILPDFKNNQAELAAVTQSIIHVNENPDLTLTGIWITGYASPEGGLAYNQKLTERRANALAEYAQKNTRIDASLWHITGAGEDWEGFQKELKQHPNLVPMDDILPILDAHEGNPDLCERRIREAVSPALYRRMLDEVYGPLRRNEYRIAYNVRSFNLEQARELLHTRPDLLSVDEMYVVADSYGKGTAAYETALLIAARTYPQHPAAVVNAVSLMIEKQDLSGAIALLSTCPRQQEGVICNAWGVVYAHQKKWDLANKAFQQALTAGYEAARENLEQVAGVQAEL